tara:strand:- start:167 stop:358 length:192 start_codon:yes stop_codon:yes gene_type:complete
MDDTEKELKALDRATALAAEDMTGQDGEEEVNQAAADLIEARNDKIRREDPDRYAEMRHFGQA